MSIYNIDHSLIYKRNTSPDMRKPKWFAWLKVLLSGWLNIHTDFLALRERVNTNLSYNIQTAIVEYMLNQTFGPGIFVENLSLQADTVFTNYYSEGGLPVYTFGYGESLDANYEEVYTSFYAELDNSFDAVIYIPTTLIDISVDEVTHAEVRALITKYLTAGKRFKVENYG